MRCSHNKASVDPTGNLELGRPSELSHLGARGLGLYFSGKGRHAGRLSSLQSGQLLG